jgi:hypothetical protein
MQIFFQAWVFTVVDMAEEVLAMLAAMEAGPQGRAGRPLPLRIFG